jgi:predicted RNA binding protein YcfA (HicA-like mRNA interferase family)
MPNLPVIRSKDFLKHLIAFGCEEVSVRGSHHKLRYPFTGKVTVVPVHGGEDTKKAMFAAILNQLGIDIDAFLLHVNNR